MMLVGPDASRQPFRHDLPLAQADEPSGAGAKKSLAESMQDQKGFQVDCDVNFK